MKVSKDSRQLSDAAPRTRGRILAMCALAVGSLAMSSDVLATESLGQAEIPVSQASAQNSYIKGTVTD